MLKNRWTIPLVLWGGLGWILVYSLTALLIPSPPSGRDAFLEIPEGTGLRKAARLLKDGGHIPNEIIFVIFGKLSGSERQIRKGEYRFESGMSPVEILRALRSGRVYLHEVTIPEGYTLIQIASLLEEKGLVFREGFVTAAADRALLNRLGIDGKSAEGYLFPTTYYFPKDIGAAGIVEAMVAAFDRTFSPEMAERARAISMTRNEVVTLASIIEKETSIEEERPLISAVFHNRLRRRIPLQSDPTVIYAIPGFDGNLKRKDLAISSPYNTYRFSGLPPGPIANPGEASLKAALHPDESGYFYFVSKNDGRHHFSATLAEHNRAVDFYQKRRTAGARSGS